MKRSSSPRKTRKPYCARPWRAISWASSCAALRAFDHPHTALLRLSSIDRVDVAMLLSRYGLELVLVAPQESIPGSYWDGSEAGLKGDRLFARTDTPIHS